MLFHLGGPLSFGAAKELVRTLAYEEDYRVLLLDLTDVPAIDYSVSRAIEDMIVDTLDQGRTVLVAIPDGDVARMLDRESVLDHLPEDGVLTDRLTALNQVERLLVEEA